jgi:hypothetical protein
MDEWMDGNHILESLGTFAGMTFSYVGTLSVLQTGFQSLWLSKIRFIVLHLGTGARSLIVSCGDSCVKN